MPIAFQLFKIYSKTEHFACLVFNGKNKMAAIVWKTIWKLDIFYLDFEFVDEMAAILSKLFKIQIIPLMTCTKSEHVRISDPRFIFITYKNLDF